MVKPLLLFFLSCLLSFTASAQSFYVSQIMYAETVNPLGVVYRINITPHGVTSTLMNSCRGSYFFSIGMDKDNFYWFDGTKFYRGDIVGDDLTNCTQVGNIQYGANSLTTGADGYLYYIEYGLRKMNPKTHEVTDIGYLNYSPSGDLTFYNNQLYMASNVGVVRINFENTSECEIVIDTRSYGQFLGLVSVATSLHKNTVYGLAYVNQNRTDIVELDLDNNKVIGVIGSLPYAVLDAASISENGSISGIKIEKINQQQDCNAPTKGIIEVITKQHNDEFTYKLNTGQTNTTGVFSNIPKGTYQLTVTSAVDQQTAEIIVPEYKLTKPVYTYKIKNRVCDEPGEVAFTTTENSYSIKLGTEIFPLNHTFKDLLAGISYHFEILNENGCKADELNLNILKDKCLIQFDKTVIEKECSTINMGKLQVITKPHADAYTYSFNSVSNTTGVFNMIDPGTYFVTITSPEDALTVPFVIPDYKAVHPDITYNKTNPACSVKGSINFNVAGDVSLYRISDGNAIYNVDHVFENLETGKHHFTVTTTHGCLVDEYDVDLQYEPCPITITKIENLPECDVYSKGRIQVFAAPIPETLSYQLNNTTNSTGIFTMLDPGSYELTVTASGGGTSQKRTIMVADYRQTHPAITYIKTNPACKDKGTIKFAIADDASLYRIKSGNDIYVLDHQFTGLNAGNYHYYIVKQNGCVVDEYDVELLYQPCPIVINKIDIAAECNLPDMGVIQVFVEPIPESLIYKLNNVTNTTGIFNLMQAGSYELTVTASGGGTPQNRTINVPDYSLSKPQTALKQVNPVCELTGQVQLGVTANAELYNISYNSSIYPLSHVFKGLYAGTHHFTILKKDNCTATEVDVTLVQETCSPVSFPNAFTPNQDGVNDLFKADPESKANNYRLQIFDRWGAVVFSTTDIKMGWNGEYRGKHATAGVYYFMATYTTQENKPGLLKGSVTLLR